MSKTPIFDQLLEERDNEIPHFRRCSDILWPAFSLKQIARMSHPSNRNRFDFLKPKPMVFLPNTKFFMDDQPIDGKVIAFDTFQFKPFVALPPGKIWPLPSA